MRMLCQSSVVMHACGLLLLCSSAWATVYLDAAQCKVSECATGYTGSAGDACPAAADAATPEQFSLSGCVPMCVLPADSAGYQTTLCDTSRGAIVEQACAVSCAAGYQSTGSGASARCSQGFGTFALSGCEAVPKCSLPSSTVGYITSSCPTSITTITEAQCSVSCDTGSGYRGSAVDACPSGGGAFILSGCSNACTLPSDTTGYLVGDCQGVQTAEQCSVACASGYAGEAVVECNVPGGEHSLSNCTALPKCSLPSSPDGGIGYVSSGCTAATVHQCALSCGGGYEGTAVDSCDTDGSEFVFSGCEAIPKCTLPADTTGYVVNAGCDNTYASQCSVSCASGYAGTAQDACQGDGQDFLFSGCEAIPKCTLPSDVTGYLPSNCDDAFASQCAVNCASNYGGAATRECPSDGAAFVFGGCTPRCSFPIPTPTGYMPSSCTGSLTVSECSVVCDAANSYGGTAAASCPEPREVFVLSGCAPMPKCRLPATNPGYLTNGCNPGRVDEYGIFASQCSVQCSAGFSGIAAAACPVDGGGTFVLTGCTRDPICELPTTTTGYKTTECATPVCGENPLDESACEVECETGYVGIARDTCESDGGNFAFSGCAPMCVLPAITTGYITTSCPTENAAIPASECRVFCGSGYRESGSGPPVATCSTGYGTFTFSGCEEIPRCRLPSSTAGYVTDQCPASSSNLLLEEQCSVRCDTASGYGGTASASCSAVGDGFVLSGCSNACTLQTPHTGYIVTGCLGVQTSEQCTVTCDAGYGGVAVDDCPSPNGKHSFSGCSALPTCNLPSDTTGYVPSGCNSAATDECSVVCATGYEGNAVDDCFSQGSDFLFSGCRALPKCTLPPDTTGYVVTAGCDNAWESQCSVNCAPGYSGTAQDTCLGEGLDFRFSGCVAIPKCTLPSQSAGYLPSNCNDNFASQCTVSCANNYGGTPTDECTIDGSEFAFAGCSPQCTLPSPMPTGYIVDSCSGSRTASQCSVACDAANNYGGAPVVSCSAPEGLFALSGCEALPTCTLPAINTGYSTTHCNPGRGTSYGITTQQCALSCAAGFTGSATATCEASGGVFQLAGCQRANVCSLPLSLVGYQTLRCQTSSASACETDPGSDGTSGETNAATKSPPAVIATSVYLSVACSVLLQQARSR